MYRRLHWLGFTLLLASTLPLAVAQDRKDLDKEKDKKQEKKDLDKEKEPPKGPHLVKIGEASGTLTNLSDNRDLTVKVTYRYMEPNASAFQNQQNLARRQFDIMRNPNPIERQQQMIQLQIDIANNQRNLYTQKEVHKDLHLQPADGVKVRSLQPPLVFDDKGNPRKYTEKELKELKGEGNLPGYASEWEQLRTGQMVTVTVARKKDAASPAGPKGKELDKDLEKKLLEADKPYATLIVIVGEPPSK